MIDEEETRKVPIPEEIVRNIMRSSEQGAEFAARLLADASSITRDARERLSREGKLRRVDPARRLCAGKDVDGVDGSWTEMGSGARCESDQET